MTPEFSLDMALVLGLIAVAVFLFVVEWVRVDVVAVLMMVSLPLLGLVTPSEAFRGLSSNAVVSILAVIIIGEGLDKTGLVNRLAAPIVRLGRGKPSRITILVSATVAVISSFMQNIGAAALFLPALQRISERLSVPLSRLLMPVGFSAILGGTVTLVGSSPLILLNDLVRPFGIEPFTLFEVTPVGLVLVAAGILYFVLLGGYVLPDTRGEGVADEPGTRKSAHMYCQMGKLFELKVGESKVSPLAVSSLSERHPVSVLGVSKTTDRVIASSPNAEVLQPGDELVVHGLAEDVYRMAEEYLMEVKENLERFGGDLCPDVPGTAEAVIPPNSLMVGKTLGDMNFRERYGVRPVALHRGEKVFYSGVSRMSLREGDVLVLDGSWERLHILQKQEKLIFNTPLTAAGGDRKKAVLAGFWFFAALFLVIVLHVQLSVGLMTGALGMVVTRVLSMDEAYRSVDWRTVFLLGGLIPLSTACEKSGAAAWIAHQSLTVMGDVAPVVFLTLTAVLTTAFSLVISNVGATVLLVPLIINVAAQTGADPRTAALVVGLAASNSFTLPTHQVNALYMSAGRYRSIDFLRAGSIMTVIFIVVLIGAMTLFFGA